MARTAMTIAPTAIDHPFIFDHFIAFGGPSHRKFITTLTGAQRVISGTGQPVEGSTITDIHEWWSNPTLPLPDVEMTTYRRYRTVWSEMPDAWAIVFVAGGYEPNEDDADWLTKVAIQGAVTAMCGGYIDPFQATLVGEIETLQSELAQIVDEVFAGMGTNAERFARSWREFFDGLDEFTGDESYSGDAHAFAEVCWRCDAAESQTDVGLCTTCLDELKETT